MRYCKFALVLFSVFGIANSATCKYQFDDEVINDTIRDIADELNITECQAGSIYNLIVKGNEIFDEALSSAVEGEKSVSQCKIECSSALDEFKDFINAKDSVKLITLLGDSLNVLNFLKKCQKDCKVVPELIDNRKREEERRRLEEERKKLEDEKPKPNPEEEKKPEEKKKPEEEKKKEEERKKQEEERKKQEEEKKKQEEEKKKQEEEERKKQENLKKTNNTSFLDRLKSLLDKRDEDTCNAIESSRINLIESNFQYGVPRFQQALNSVETAITQVNGCGPKLFNKYSIGESYQGLFLPACNSHDVCYDCQMGKSVCDNNFLSNLKKMCDTKYNTKKLVEKILHAECYAKANIFYKAVDLFGSGSYDRCGNIFNSNKECAFCGNSVVHNVLVNSAFYIKKEK